MNMMLLTPNFVARLFIPCSRAFSFFNLNAQLSSGRRFGDVFGAKHETTHATQADYCESGFLLKYLS